MFHNAAASRIKTLSICLSVAFAASSHTAHAAPATVLYNDQVVTVDQTLADPTDLWVTPDDLTRINGFVLKPEGACLDSICIPVKQSSDSDIVVTRSAQKWFNVTEFADMLSQAYVVDHDSGTWSFGEIPLHRDSFLSNAEAPDFTLPDGFGNMVSLSDFRGKKVYLGTWASWCGCRLDVPSWDVVYKELKEHNFEVILVAEDTGGMAAAGKYYEDADVTFTALIDETHKISSLYNFVNVPSGAWIDEKGKIVRINEGTYAAKHGSIGTDDYSPAVRDWVMNGEKSQYVWNTKQVAEHIKPRSDDAERADPAFKLGLYFFANDDREHADIYWKMAQGLSPDNINYFRQDLFFTEEGSFGKTYMDKRKEIIDSGKTYYTPLEL